MTGAPGGGDGGRPHADAQSTIAAMMYRFTVAIIALHR
jgi:hypothetical protein